MCVGVWTLPDSNGIMGEISSVSFWGSLRQDILFPKKSKKVVYLAIGLC